MKKISVLLLALIMLILPIMSLSSCTLRKQVHTVVGEVMYVTHTTMYVKKSDIKTHYAFIKPLGQSDNSEWIMFEIKKDKTELEGAFSPLIEEMPVLSVGNIVEISFVEIEKTVAAVDSGYNAISIKSVTADDIVADNNYKFELDFKDNYLKYGSNHSYSHKGKIIHVARVEYPKKGYIVYFENYAVTAEKYWFEDDTLSDYLLAMFESGLVGYTAEVNYTREQPFYNRDIRRGLAISIFD